MCVCVCVCVCVSMYVCMCVRVYVCVLCIQLFEECSADLAMSSASSLVY